MDFREGDARNLPFADGTFEAVVLMGNSFGYFVAQEDDAAALREVRRVVKAGTPVLFDLTDRAHLRACDYARLDADGHPCLLEVSPNPGWCFDGHLTA